MVAYFLTAWTTTSVSTITFLYKHAIFLWIWMTCSNIQLSFEICPHLILQLHLEYCWQLILLTSVQTYSWILNTADWNMMPYSLVEERGSVSPARKAKLVKMYADITQHCYSNIEMCMTAVYGNSLTTVDDCRENKGTKNVCLKEGESSLPCSQQHTTSPCFRPVGSKPHPHTFLVAFSITLPSSPGLPNDLFLLGPHRKHFCENFLRRSSRDSVVGIADTLRTGRFGFRISVGRGTRFFSFPERLDPTFFFFVRG